jgi:hypothetical protein
MKRCWDEPVLAFVERVIRLTSEATREVGTACLGDGGLLRAERVFDAFDDVPKVSPGGFVVRIGHDFTDEFLEPVEFGPGEGAGFIGGRTDLHESGQPSDVGALKIAPVEIDGHGILFEFGPDSIADFPEQGMGRIGIVVGADGKFGHALESFFMKEGVEHAPLVIQQSVRRPGRFESEEDVRGEEGVGGAEGVFVEEGDGLALAIRRQRVIDLVGLTIPEASFLDTADDAGDVTEFAAALAEQLFVHVFEFGVVFSFMAGGGEDEIHDSVDVQETEACGFDGFGRKVLGLAGGIFEGVGRAEAKDGVVHLAGGNFLEVFAVPFR